MKTWICAFVFFFSFTSWSRTIVVSDIDDTLKISHVRSTTDKVLNAPRTDVVYSGMPELFRTLEQRGDVEFVYLSNAPSWLMDESHKTFLDYNLFPRGRVFLRPFGSGSTTFKREILDQLIAEEAPETEWILIGDNGERDPIVFRDLMRDYPALKIRSYVHAVYPDNVEGVTFAPLLRPYATAYDLALHWTWTGLLTLSQIETTEKAVKLAIYRDLRNEPYAEQVFPSWTDCHPHLEFEGDPRYTREWADLLSVGCRMGRE